MSNKEKAGYWLIAFAVVMVWLAAESMSNEDESASILHYCAMTQLYQESGGDKGWPDYDPSINCGGE